ncbi:MAG: choice-of-anchor Q domain-containing protein [Sporichthyaceae bacterium]
MRRAAILTCAALAATVPGAPALAVDGPLELFVATAGADGANDCTDAARPCRTPQRAVDVASGPAGTGRTVVVSIGPGTFLPRDGGVHVRTGSPTSLTIAGAGADTTTLRTPLPNSGEVVALTVAAGFVAPVRVTALRIAGHGFDATPGGGGGGSFVTAIKATNPGLLRVDSVRIDHLTGGHGAGSRRAAGGDGGSVYGIDRIGGPTELTAVHIDDLVGGTGGAASGGPRPRPGGSGGSAYGVNTDGALKIDRSTVGGLRGGPGGRGASGGDAYSVVVQGNAPIATAIVEDSELSGNRGGLGGRGLDGGPGTAGGVGGSGGDAVGISYVGHLLSVENSTLSGHRGARGGRGGTGGVAEAKAPAGGAGGPGGAAVGALSTSLAAVAAATFADSTLSDNRAGVGGGGGAGGSDVRGRRGPGGDGGGGGTLAAGLVALAGPNVALTTSAVHVTAVDNLGARGGAPGRGGVDGRSGPASTTAAGLTSNAPVHLAASLLDNGSAANCELSDAAPLLDGGWNVVSDTTCGHGGAGTTVVPGIGGDLAPLADNGGPTRTRAVPATSSAARAVAAVGGLCGGRFALDQRGMPRPGSAGPHHCAAGAFEPA